MSIIRRIKSKYSYTYRLRHGWGISVIRNDREMKALIEFCKTEAEDYRKVGFNESSHLPVWEETVRLYKFWKKNGTGSSELYDYIDAHVGWYWS